MNHHKIPLISLFSLFCFTLSAQYNTLSEWYIGPSGGVSMSNITLVPKTVDKLYYTGRTIGFTARYVSEAHFGFQLECNYMEAGWKEDYLGNGIASEYSYERQLHFVDVPFLVHAYAAAKSVRFYLNAGPKFSYLLSESEENKQPSLAYAEHGKLVENPFQYGILGGGGLEMHLGRNILGLEGRYCYYLSNLFSDAVGEDFVTSDLQTMSLNVYYYFQLTGFKKK